MKTGKTLKDIIKEEYLKCSQDPVYFMRRYCKVQHPQRGKIPFNLYDFQARTLTDFKQHRYNIILKARQLGLSTLTAGYSLWMMTFQEDKNILVIATKQDVAKNLITKVRVMYDNLPSWLKTATQEDNKMSLRFVNGSHIKSVSSKPDAGRSEALSLLILDEAAFIDYIDTIWTAAQQTLATGGQCIVLSTPNGMGNWFEKQWSDAEDGKSEFNPIKLHWSVHPERDQEWRDYQDKLLGPKQAAQECDCDFLTSGATVIPLSLLDWYEQTYVIEPLEKRGIDKGLWIFEYPDYKNSYMVMADVARGDGADYSAFHVIDLASLRQVAEYEGKIDTRELAHLLISVATEYNEALLVVENSNVGWDTIQEIIDRNYSNLFYSSADLKYVDIQRQVNNKINRQDKSLVAGYTISSRTRPLQIAKMHGYFDRNEVIIQSQRTIKQLKFFIWHNGRGEAMRGKNDDLVMALSMGLWVRDTAIRLKQESVELTKKALNGFKVNKPQLATYNRYLDDARRNAYKMPLQNGTVENLDWLI